MKTTIEINGYEIVIEEIDGTISVSAVKDEEVIEEFEIQAEGESQGDDSEEAQDFDGDEVQDFGEFGSEESQDEFEEGEESEESQDEFEEGEESEESQDEEEVEGSKLESFNSFLKKRK